MAYPYPGLEHVRDVAPTLRQAIQHRDVPVKDVVHAIFVVEGFGLSMYPGDPAIFGAADGPYSADQALGDLELLTSPESEGKFAARAIPWTLLLTFLMAMLKEYLNKP